MKNAEEKKLKDIEVKNEFENAILMIKNGKLYVHNSNSEICTLADYLNNDEEMSIIGGLL